MSEPRGPMGADPALAGALEALYRQADIPRLLAHDPVRFVRRYPAPEDAELVAFLAAGFAFGRVDLFARVLETLLAHMDLRGGPRALVEGLDPAVEARALAGLKYRWITGDDVVMALRALRGALRQHGSLGALARAQGPPDLPMRQRLEGFSAGLARALVEAGGPSAEAWSRGVGFLLSAPSGGSACKRMNMMMRWMVRPPTEGVDLGLWEGISPATLIMPLDVHVLRAAGFLGLVQRQQAQWSVAEQLTAALRQVDADDPVRFDFALAHLGISGGCAGGRTPHLCPRCPLDPVCGAPPLQEGGGSPVRASRKASSAARSAS